MPAALTVAIQIISALIPLVSAGSKAYAEIRDSLSVIKQAQDAGRDLTDEEFVALVAKATAAGDDLAQLAKAAEAELGGR